MTNKHDNKLWEKIADMLDNLELAAGNEGADDWHKFNIEWDKLVHKFKRG